MRFFAYIGKYRGRKISLSADQSLSLFNQSGLNMKLASQLLTSLYGCVFLSVLVSSQRFCYVCSGDQCLKDPSHPDVLPGKTECHPSLEYCSAHVRYLPSNKSLGEWAVGQPYNSKKPLSPADYSPQSATRACAKIQLGNTCRRDWLGKPEITCIITCDTDLCNCGSRSPPEAMFKNGKVLALAPENSIYKAKDVDSCVVRKVPKEKKTKKPKPKRTRYRGMYGRKNNADSKHQFNSIARLLNVLFIILLYIH